MNDRSPFGEDRARRQGLLFLGGLTLVVVGSVASNVLAPFDVGVRVVGYGLALLATAGYLRARIGALRGRLGRIREWFRLRRWLPF